MPTKGRRDSAPGRRTGASAGNKDAPISSGHKRLGGAEVVARLNQMVAGLIAENRKLEREVARLLERAAARSAPKARSKPRPKPRLKVRSASSTRKKRAAAPTSRRKPTAAVAAQRKTKAASKKR